VAKKTIVKKKLDKKEKGGIISDNIISNKSYSMWALLCTDSGK